MLWWVKFGFLTELTFVLSFTEPKKDFRTEILLHVHTSTVGGKIGYLNVHLKIVKTMLIL
jgi:hypothetical protein